MQLDLHPPTGVGPVAIGAPVEAAEALLSGLEGFVAPDPLRPRRRGFVPFQSGLSIALHGDREGNIVAIEVYKSDFDEVLFDRTDVFRTPASDVIEILGARTSIRIEENGRTVIAPELPMSLWRGTLPVFPGDMDGRFFETVLVARSGYFAVPADS